MWKWAVILLVACIPWQLAAANNKDSEAEIRPTIREEPLKKIKYTYKLENFMPMLENVLVVEDSKLKQKKRKKKKKKKKSQQTLSYERKKDFTLDTKEQKYVIGFAEELKDLAVAGDRVFVAGVATDRHLKYVFVRPEFSHYKGDGEYLGTEMQVIGSAKAINRDDPSILEIESAIVPIKRGEMVLPSRSLNLPSTIEAKVPLQKLQGHILSLIPHMAYGSSNNVVLTSLGRRDGVKVGDVLQVALAKRTLTDPYDKKKQHAVSFYKNKGELVIYDVFDKVSLGLVTSSANDFVVMDQIFSE